MLVAANRPWAAKAKYIKISPGAGAELRCAEQALGVGAQAFSVMTKTGGKVKCATFAGVATPCAPGQTKPSICKRASTGAYRLNEPAP